jgi:hypothetical protein
MVAGPFCVPTWVLVAFPWRGSDCPWLRLWLPVVVAVILGALGRSSLGRALPDDRRLHRSLISRGLQLDARSFPSGLGRMLFHFPRASARRSLISRGLQLDALSFPSGLGRMLFHFPRVGWKVRRRWLGLGLPGRGAVVGLCDGLHGRLVLGFWVGLGVLWGCFPCVCGGFGWCWGGFGVGVGRV